MGVYVCPRCRSALPQLPTSEIGKVCMCHGCFASFIYTAAGYEPHRAPPPGTERSQTPQEETNYWLKQIAYLLLFMFIFGMVGVGNGCWR